MVSSVKHNRRWRRRRRRADLRPVLVALLLLSTALPGRADLVVFSGGHTLKIDQILVSGETVRLALSSGGVLVVPLTAIERVVDDEIVIEPEINMPDAHLQLTFSASAAVPETPYGDLIFDTARRHGVSSDLVAAMVRAESSFDPGAVSHKGARGLLQLMPATALRFGVSPDALFDPGQNLEAGVGYLKWLSERYSDAPSLVLAAYNAGEGSVDRYDGVPPYRETREYIRRIYSSLDLDADSALTATR